jgi:hypothetical protein
MLRWDALDSVIKLDLVDQLGDPLTRLLSLVEFQIKSSELI